MPEFLNAAKVSELKPGSAKVIEAGGKTIALCHAEGKFYALDNTCLHRGGPVGEGFIDGELITCPWHGWQYDVKTGQSTMNPGAKLACYETRIEGDDILVEV